MHSLLTVEGKDAVPFVAEFLTQRGEPRYNEEVGEFAAIALGASHLPEARAALQQTWQASLKPQLSRALLRAIGISRAPEAFGFLLGLVTHGRQHDAMTALQALAIHRDLEAIHMSVQAAVSERADAALQSAFHQDFGPASFE